MSNCWNSGDGFKAEVDDLRGSSSFRVKRNARRFGREEAGNRRGRNGFAWVVAGSNLRCAVTLERSANMPLGFSPTSDPDHPHTVIGAAQRAETAAYPEAQGAL